MYVFVEGGDVGVSDSRVPTAARRLDTREWVLGLREASTELQEECGWFEVDEVASPAIGVTQRATFTFELVAGRPAQVWTVRSETSDERFARTRLENRQIMRDPTANLARITSLREFLSDPDVVTFMGRANNTPWDATDRRAAKTAFRTIDRIVKALEAEVRSSIGGELLDELPPS